MKSNTFIHVVKLSERKVLHNSMELLGNRGIMSPNKSHKSSPNFFFSFFFFKKNLETSGHASLYSKKSSSCWDLNDIHDMRIFTDLLFSNDNTNK